MSVTMMGLAVPGLMIMSEITGTFAFCTIDSLDLSRCQDFPELMIVFFSDVDESTTLIESVHDVGFDFLVGQWPEAFMLQCGKIMGRRARAAIRRKCCETDLF